MMRGVESGEVVTGDDDGDPGVLPTGLLYSTGELALVGLSAHVSIQCLGVHILIPKMRRDLQTKRAKNSMVSASTHRKPGTGVHHISFPSGDCPVGHLRCLPTALPSVLVGSGFDSSISAEQAEWGVRLMPLICQFMFLGTSHF
nr:hypothetical protein Iba_chr10eCG4270 [Ipomoea batatas]